MTLTRRKDGTYEGLWRRKGMKPLHLSLRTSKRKDAKDRHDAIQTAVRAGRFPLIEQLRRGDVTVEQITAMVTAGEALVPVVAEPAPIASVEVAPASSPWDTVDEAAARYLKARRANPNVEPRTVELAGFQLQAFRDFEYEGQRIGARALDRVPSGAIQAYQSAMLAGGRPANSVTTYMGRVSSLWTWAIEQEQRDARDARRPARELFSPVVPELLFRKKQRRERMLTVQEADSLLAATPAPLLWFVGCGLLAGLRANETLHLRPGIDVDLELGTITVREQADWKPKTERSKRLVPMAPSLLEIARVHTARFANDSWMMPSPASPMLPITDLAVRQHFKAIVERAGLIYGRDEPQGVTYHTLRHSFASHAVMRGVDLYTVAKLLGDTVKTVEDVYADLSPDFKRAAVAKLAGAFTLPEFSKTDTTSDTAEGQK